MSLEKHSFSISDLNMRTIDVLLIEVITYDKEIEGRKEISVQMHS